MNGVPTALTGAIPLIAAVVLLVPASQARSAELGHSAEQTLSIGLPSENDTDFNNGAFRLNGSSLDSLAVERDIGPFSLRGGKINPAVGILWARPGSVRAPAIAADHDPAVGDDVGLSASVRFRPHHLGTHRLTGGTTFPSPEAARNDALSYRSGANEPPGRRGGIDPSSLQLTLEGGHFPAVPDMSYRIGYSQRKGGADAPSGESGFAAGIANRFDLSTGLALTPSVEAARLTDTDATGRDYVGASMLTEWRNWNLSLSYGRRDVGDPSATLIDNYEAGASIGYAFDFGATADLGWSREKQAEEIADHIGFRFKYRFGF